MSTPAFVLAAALFLFAAEARAEGKTHGGVSLVVRAEPAYFVWSLDGAQIRSQAGPDAPNVDALLIGETQNAPGAALHLGVKLFGHATVGVDLSATGWDLGDVDRGGAGFLAGTVAWHPIRLFESLEVLTLEDRPWDAQLFFGMGYGLVGEDRALDGFHTELGFRGEYFLTRFLSVGGGLRLYPLAFSRYAVNWNAGSFIALPNGSGGSVLIPFLSLSLHALIAD